MPERNDIMGECCALHQSSFTPSTLDYVSAAHGGWGIVRIAALVPESHMLFVCPSACGRHTALGGAVNGIKDRVSYLFLQEADIVSGDFEKMIVDNVSVMLKMLPKRPKAIFIFTSCLDDLLGTDHEPILEELGRREKGIEFRHCSMNPISLNTSNPPGISAYVNMFSLLKKRPTDEKQINVLGSPVPYSGECDLKQILGKKGYRVMNIGDCTDYESFLSMASARLNIVSAPIALRAAQELEKNFGIPYIKAFVNYDPQKIESFYKELSDALGEDLMTDSYKYKAEAEEKLRQTAELLDGYPVAVDYQAVLRPYTLALTLSCYGFNVGMIASDNVSAFEKESLEELKVKNPRMLVENPMHHDAVKFPHQGEKYLCIGFDCGYMTSSDKVVNIMEDEGLFGYYGIIQLMNMISEAFSSSADVHGMIKEAGLII